MTTPVGGLFSALPASDTTPNARDARADAAAPSFAGLLAGVMFAAAPKLQAAPATVAGTSELDQQDATGVDDDATGSTGKDKSTGSDPVHGALATVLPTSPNDIVRSVAALDPALQAKLSRVIQRVQSETGHEVEVAETFRTQSRQDALYEQGRDTAGPVVTWTHNSKHTQGRAVDLILDGGKAGPNAYAALQRIANEEGLHTLGARDPGHLELPGTGAAVDETSLMPDAPADATGPGGVSIARLAQLAPVSNIKIAQPSGVARVAQVAQVASTARVAQVAQPGQIARVAQAAAPDASARPAAVRANPTTSMNSASANTEFANAATTHAHVAYATAANATSMKATAANPASVAASQLTSNAANAANAHRANASQPALPTSANVPGKATPNAATHSAIAATARNGARGQNTGDQANDSGTQSDSRGRYGSLGAFPMRDTTSNQFSTGTVAPASGTDAAARAEHVQSVMDNAPARPLSHITMSVDAGNGNTDQIHVALRGSSLDTTINAADLRGAQAMSARSDELVRALTKDGMQVDSVRVRAATDQGGIAAAAGSQAGQNSGDASNQSRFQRSDAWQQQQDQRERQQTQQDRQSRQQQREQRGGRK